MPGIGAGGTWRVVLVPAWIVPSVNDWPAPFREMELIARPLLPQP
jgi:hypothetical protein